MTLNDITIDIKEELHLSLFKILNIIFKWKLKESDIKVLAALYDKNEELRETTSLHEDRMTILFSSKVRKELISKIGLSYNSFNNNLFFLRKKGFIEDKNLIVGKDGNNPYGVMFNSDKYNLNIKFVNA